MMKQIPGYETQGYMINESGIVINKNGHVLRTAVSNSGYLRTCLMNPNAKDKNDRTNESIHRLVAQTFIPNPDNLPVVMHKDNDPLNNHVSNLQWGTQSENIQQAFRDGRKGYKYKVYNDDTGHFIICNSRSEVSDLIGYSEISLKNMVGNGHKISCGPYKGYQIQKLNKNNFINIIRVVK